MLPQNVPGVTRTDCYSGHCRVTPFSSRPPPPQKTVTQKYRRTKHVNGVMIQGILPVNGRWWCCYFLDSFC